MKFRPFVDLPEELSDEHLGEFRLQTLEEEDPAQALDHYLKASRTVDQADDPELAAAFALRIAHGILAVRPGDLKALSQAIESFELAESLLGKESDRNLKIEAAESLADALLERAQFGRPEDLDHAIDKYSMLLSSLDGQAESEARGDCLNNLGYAYWWRASLRNSQVNTDSKSSASDIEKALEAHRLALRIRRRSIDPIGWAESSINLGLAYADRPGSRVQNLEKAIIYCERALTELDPETTPVIWAIGTMNLALAYWDRLRGERASNLERALALLERALPTLEQGDPVDWAFAQNNLGLIYWDRLEGNRADNLERAVTAFERALSVTRRDVWPRRWAIFTMNLGKAIREKLRDDRTENMERALRLFESALEELEPGSRDWARVQNHLGVTYSERLHGDPDENLRAALVAHEQALEVLVEDRDPLWSGP